MNRRRNHLKVLLLAAAAGCAPPPAPPPPPPPAPPPPPPFEFPYSEVWTAAPGAVLRGDGVASLLPRPFTRLRVLEADTLGLLVRCAVCPDSATGRLETADVVYRSAAPGAAGRASLAEFALAVRDAAARGDLAALRPVLSPDFTFSFVGQQNPDAALAAWAAEGGRTLARVPALLDRGLSTRDSLLWVAPPEYLDRLDHQGLRLGFRRAPDGAWQWIFLVRGELEP